MALAGYPCKSISKQNNKAEPFKDATSKTGSGFKATMQYTDYARPSVLITENVASMSHKRASFDNEVPINIQNDAMKRRGYDCWYWVVNANQFGLQQSRTRCWAVYIKREEYNLERNFGFVEHVFDENLLVFIAAFFYLLGFVWHL